MTSKTTKTVTTTKKQEAAQAPPLPRPALRGPEGLAEALEILERDGRDFAPYVRVYRVATQEDEAGASLVDRLAVDDLHDVEDWLTRHPEAGPGWYMVHLLDPKGARILRKVKGLRCTADRRPARTPSTAAPLAATGPLTREELAQAVAEAVAATQPKADKLDEFERFASVMDRMKGQTPAGAMGQFAKDPDFFIDYGRKLAAGADTPWTIAKELAPGLVDALSGFGSFLKDKAATARVRAELAARTAKQAPPAVVEESTPTTATVEDDVQEDGPGRGEVRDVET